MSRTIQTHVTRTRDDVKVIIQTTLTNGRYDLVAFSGNEGPYPRQKFRYYDIFKTPTAFVNVDPTQNVLDEISQITIQEMKTRMGYF